MLTVTPFAPTDANLRALWEHVKPMRDILTDEFPADPFAFVCWAFPSDAVSFEVRHERGHMIGWFLFTNIRPGDSAWSHIFVWDQSEVSPLELVEAARTACGAIFRAFNVARINGLTPVSKPEARVFAKRVGFQIEGTVRSAAVIGGKREDAWISGLLPSDLEFTLVPKQRDTIEAEVP